MTLKADARRLITDVWTTGGVLIGVAAVAVTGWERLDPIIALIVAAQILVSRLKLLKESALGLMDTASPSEELRVITEILDKHSRGGVRYYALRTRQAGAQRFFRSRASSRKLVRPRWTQPIGGY